MNTLLEDLAMEVMAHQIASPFRNELIQSFKNAIDAEGNVGKVDAALNHIQKITMDNTGIWMEPVMAEPKFLDFGYRCSVQIENLNALSPINEGAVERLKDADLANLKVSEVLNGKIDLKRGKVSGFYSRIKNKFILSYSMLEGKFTAGELAALYAHELGHPWVNYFYLGETLSTNVLLAEAMKRIDTEETVSKRFLIGQAAVKASGNPKKLPEDADEAVIIAMVLEGQNYRMRNEYGSRWYDERLAEQLADQFSARWGFGADLVTAQGKMQRTRGVLATSGYDPKWLGATANFITLISLPFSLLKKGFVRFSTQAVSNLTSSVALATGLTTIGYMLGDGKYDRPKERIAAVRREIVGLLKNPHLPVEERDRALADLEIIDNEVKTIHGFGDVMNALARFAIGALTGRRESLKNNALSEELVNNRLYELSALLKKE